MPTTEAPTSPPSPPPERHFRRRRSRYEDLEQDELLHLIDKLEDERSRARQREGVWISVFAHIVLFWLLFFGPKFLWHQPRVVNPAKNHNDLTYLNLPPDALKATRPRVEAPPSIKSRIPQPRPTLDRKTLQQLQATRQAVPPAPPPPPPKAAEQPAQQAQVQPPRPVPAPLPPQPTQQAEIEPPKPAPSRPNFNTGPQTPGDAIRQAIQNAARNPKPGFGGDYGANAPSQNSDLNAGVDILSDTMGVDFGPYMQRVINATYRSWLPIIPESARSPLNKQGKVGIRFKIYPDGSVKQMILEFPSGDVALDRAAWGGITGASPYPPLPKEFKGPYLELRFGFYYNIDPSKAQ